MNIYGFAALKVLYSELEVVYLSPGHLQLLALHLMLVLKVLKCLEKALFGLYGGVHVRLGRVQHPLTVKKCSLEVLQLDVLERETALQLHILALQDIDGGLA